MTMSKISIITYDPKSFRRSVTSIDDEPCKARLGVSTAFGTIASTSRPLRSIETSLAAVQTETRPRLWS